jgi:hypothetical protein
VWWQSARNRGIAGIGLEDVHLDVATNAPVLGLALPVIDPDTKEVLGVIRGLIRLTDLQRRISQKAVSVNGDIRVSRVMGGWFADTVSNHAAALILTPMQATSSRGTMRRRSRHCRPGLAWSQLRLSPLRAGVSATLRYSRTSGSEFYDSGPYRISGAWIGEWR